MIRRMDAVDRKILSLLVEDGRRTYDDIAARVSLSAPSVKRRDRPAARAAARWRGSRRWSTTAAMGWNTEALVELFFQAGTTLDRVATTLREHPEVVEAWSVTGEADAIARVRTEDNAALERLIMDLQQNGLVIRTRSQVVMSRLVSRAGEGPRRGPSGVGGAPSPGRLALIYRRDSSIGVDSRLGWSSPN